jgi:hypothetical protein
MFFVGIFTKYIDAKRPEQALVLLIFAVSRNIHKESAPFKNRAKMHMSAGV